jgi:enoyl-CoA hydratase
MTGTGDVLTVDIADRIAVLILDRPDRRNALNGALLAAIDETLRAVDADDDVDVVILTGRDPAFCAGLDLEELATGRLTWKPPAGQRGPFPPTSKPVIGAVNGPAVTGGFELALACDFLIASERARFADTHARVGVMPDWGLSVMLPQAIGVRRARMMSFTGNQVDARMAYEWGLVCEVTAHDDLLPRALVLAAEMAANDQEAVRHLRHTYAEVTGGDLREGWEREHELAADWRGRAADRLASLDERRRAIIDRGSSQL